MKTKLVILLQIIILLSIPPGCVKEEEDVVPDVAVNFQINLDYPQFSSLNSVNNAILYSNEGYKRNGVIVYRFSLDEFFAFDATCPQHIETATAIILDRDGTAGSATCPECNTIYFFANMGYPAEGHSLKRYNVTFQGNILNVYN